MSRTQSSICSLMSRPAAISFPAPAGCAKFELGRGGSGKRGGARVIYYFDNADFPVLLVAIYAKNEKTDVSAQEKKKFVALVQEITAQWQRK